MPPSLSFPTRGWRGAPGDLTSVLSRTMLGHGAARGGQDRNRTPGNVTGWKSHPTRPVCSPCLGTRPAVVLDASWRGAGGMLWG